MTTKLYNVAYFRTFNPDVVIKITQENDGSTTVDVVGDRRDDRTFEYSYTQEFHAVLLAQLKSLGLKDLIYVPYQFFPAHSDAIPTGLHSVAICKI